MTSAVEVMARALCRHDGYSELPMWDHYLPEAQAALSALDAAGFVVVPKEPTEAMTDAGWQAREARNNVGENTVLTWQAMIQAARSTP